VSGIEPVDHEKKTHVASAPHEIKARLFWSEYGAKPYFTLSKFIRALDGGTEAGDPIVAKTNTGTNHAPEHSEIHLNYHTGKIAPRMKDSRDPEKGMWEFTLKWRGAGERKATFQIKPRWRDLRHVETRDRISTPFDHTGHEEGLEAYVQGSNLEPDEYIHVLRESCSVLAREIGENWSPRYFKPENILPRVSRIHAHERYLRVHRKYTDQMCGLGGIFQKLQSLYGGEKGTHIRLDLDNTETIGYQNKAELPDHSVHPLPGLSKGVKLEWYHPSKVRGQERVDAGDALAHPKHEVLFRMGQNKGENLKLNSESVPWGQRNDLVRELEEFLLNTLSWGGVPISHDATGVFVPDKHFEPEPSPRKIQLFEDPTPEMEVARESQLVRALADAKGREISMLEQLVSDGGQAHYQTLMDELGVSKSTYYRALEQLNDLVESQNGTVGFVCSKIHEDLREIFELAEHGKAQIDYAKRATERVLSLSENILDNASGALTKWAAKWGVEFEERDTYGGDTRLAIKIQSVLNRHGGPKLADVLDDGYSAWSDAGRRISEFVDAIVEYDDAVTGTERTLVNKEIVV